LIILGLLSPKKGKLENRSVSISAVELQNKAFQSLHEVFGHSTTFSVMPSPSVLPLRGAILVCCSDSKTHNITFAAPSGKKLHSNAQKTYNKRWQKCILEIYHFL